MQSSCNLIKNNNALVSGNRSISTNYRLNSVIEVEEEECYIPVDYSQSEMIVKQYEELAVGILEKARADAEKILMQSRESAVLAEKEAYEKGYAQGKENGYEDGYREGTEKAISDSQDKVTKIINRASSILSTASDDYKQYMDDKKSEITELILHISKVVCNVNFENDKSILKLIEPIIENYKGETSLIIRSNTKYTEALKEITALWKNTYNIKGEIFILEDPLMEIGNAVVETNKGKATVGIDISFERLEKIIKERMVGGDNA